MPEHVTFNLKYGPSNSDHENYIVLPLDTKIRMASQLCNPDISGIPIVQDRPAIASWELETQEVIYEPRGLGPASCIEILMPNSPYDFQLEPGKVYKIIVDADANWRQI